MTNVELGRPRRARRHLLGCLACGALGVALLAPSSRAQDAAPSDEASRKELLERMRALEEKVKRLETREDAPADSSDEEWSLEGGTSELPPEPEKKAEEPAKEPYRPGPYGRRHGYGFEKKGLVLETPYGLRARLGGAIRARGEYRAPADLRIPGQAGRPATDDPDDADDFALLRTRLSLDVQAHRHLRALIELQDSRTFGDVAASTDEASIGLRQGFMELAEPFDLDLWVWVGRWKVPDLGEKRIFGQQNFNNVSRSWDGVQVFGHLGGTSADPLVWFTAFAANVREGRVFSTTADENDDFWISAVYATVHGMGPHTVDLYGVWRHLSDRVFESEKRARLGDRKDFTLGVRSALDVGVFGWALEAVWQYGDQAGDRVRAWATAARVWGKLDLDKYSHVRFGLDYAFASGDRDPNDGKRQSFEPIAPAFQGIHGRMNLFRWSNLHNVAFVFSYSPPIVGSFSLNAEVHGFWLDQNKDAWFSPTGVVRRDTTGRAHSFVGTELDLFARWVLWEDRLKLIAGYSHFWGGRFVRQTGKGTPGNSNGGDQDWVWLSAELTW